MDEQKKEESMEGFTNLLGNFRVEKFFGASHNNSKDDLNLLSDLLDLQKLDKDNLLDTKDLIALDPLNKNPDNSRKNEMQERAFKAELSLNSEPFIIFSRNNGIAKKQKKNGRRRATDEFSYPEAVENYLSLPLREDNNLDFTLQPPTMSTEMTNFESLGPNRNLMSDIQNNIEYPHRNVPAFNIVQENVPFLLGHPAQKNQFKESNNNDSQYLNAIDQCTTEKKDKEFSIHEISFNRDQFSNSMRTEQDTMRSLQLPKHYEMVEEEAEDEGMTSQAKNVRDFPLQMSHDKYRDSPKELPMFKEEAATFVPKSQNEPINRANSEKVIRDNSQENILSHEEKTGDATENQLLAIFYQIVNENKFLKQEMASVHHRLDELSKQKEAETEIICNLQQNLELTMMLLKKRDEEFAKLQKKHDELARNLEICIDQSSKPSLDYYLGPARPKNFPPQADFDEQGVDRSTRRSSSFTNAVHNSIRLSKQDLRKQMQYENQRSQKSFHTHFSEIHSGFDNDISQDASIDHRRNSSHTLRGASHQNLDRKEGNYDTGGDYDSRSGYLVESQNYNNGNKTLHNQMIKRSGFGSQQSVQEREEMIVYNKQQNVKGVRKESVGKNWIDKEQEKIGMKENRYGPPSSNRPSSMEPVNINNVWIGGASKQNMERGNEPKLKSKIQNYKKYSEMFKRQKEAFDLGSNYAKEELKGKIQRK